MPLRSPQFQTVLCLWGDFFHLSIPSCTMCICVKKLYSFTSHQHLTSFKSTSIPQGLKGKWRVIMNQKSFFHSCVGFQEGRYCSHFCADIRKILQTKSLPYLLLLPRDSSLPHSYTQHSFRLKLDKVEAHFLYGSQHGMTNFWRPVHPPNACNFLN